MASNLFDRLAELEVPPPPAQFDTQLHEKVNRSLVSSHLVDLFLRGFPWALGHFAKAFVGLLEFTVTGRYDASTNKRKHR